MSFELPCCSICSGPYVADIKVARMLPCGDSFCEDCLVKDSNLTNCHECQAQNTKSLEDCPINNIVMRIVKQNDAAPEESLDNFFHKGELSKTSNVKNTVHELMKEIILLENFINEHTTVIKLSEIKIINATKRRDECKADYSYLHEALVNVVLNKESQSFEDTYDKIKEQISRNAKYQEVLQDSIRRLGENEKVEWGREERKGKVTMTSHDGGNVRLHRLQSSSTVKSFLIDSDSVLLKPYSKTTVTFICKSMCDESRSTYLQVDGTHRYGEEFVESCLGLNGGVAVHKPKESYYEICRVNKSSDLSNETCNLGNRNLRNGDLYIEHEDQHTITYAIYCNNDQRISCKVLGKVIDGFSYLEQDYRKTLHLPDSGVVLFNLK